MVVRTAVPPSHSASTPVTCSANSAGAYVDGPVGRPAAVGRDGGRVVGHAP